VSLVPYLHLGVTLAGGQAGDRLALEPAARHHLTRVLRLRDGADVEVSDGRGGHAAARLTDGEVVLTAGAVVTPPPRPSLTVAQALPKGRKLDEVVRQVTELGADRIVPVAAARSVTRLAGDRADRAVERWAAVARAAAEQARRPWLPEIAPATDAGALVGSLPTGSRVLVAHVGGELALPDAVAGCDAAHLAVAVGPEGGWSEEEVEAFVADGAVPVGLGPAVLRTEHAAAAALAVLGALAGRWSCGHPRT
jgi:16S rRNA (uracil1498-N3)-methyltransferase